MEPDLHVLAGAPAGVSGAYAGDHTVGPSQGEGGGERVSGRGKKTRRHPSGTLTDMELFPYKTVNLMITTQEERSSL